MVKRDSPPKPIQQALEQTVKERYQDLGQPPITIYSKKAGRWEAVVSFHSAHSTAVAQFQYVENNSGEFYWYCRQDWND